DPSLAFELRRVVGPARDEDGTVRRDRRGAGRRDLGNGGGEVLARVRCREARENGFGDGARLLRSRAAVHRREEREVSAARVEGELPLSGARLPRSKERHLGGLERAVGGDSETRSSEIRLVLEHAALHEDAVWLAAAAEVVAVQSHRRRVGAQALL